MELQTINQVSKIYGVSARMLRYYEQIGLIASLRKEDYAYRVYDQTALVKLQQVLILRKLRIPLRQISVILNQPDASEAVEIFKQNIAELEDEINALSTIKAVLNRLAEALQKRVNIRLDVDILTDSSVLSIIGSIPPSKNHIKEAVSMEELGKADERIGKLLDVRIIYLPPMAVAASHATGENCEGRAGDALYQFARESRLLEIKPDTRQFGFDCSGGETGIGEASHGYELWVSIPEEMKVPSPLVKRKFEGGYYAAHMIKAGDFDHWLKLREWVHNSEQYENDWGSIRWTPYEAGMEHCLEEQLNFWGNLQNPDFKSRDMQLDLLFPVKPKAK